MSNLSRIKSRIAIIAGMPRAATTFLYYTLPGHPSIFVPSRKELAFFSFNFERGIEWYLSHFRDMAKGQIGFDMSPLYFFHPDVPTRLLQFNAKIRVILMVRDPAEFVISFFKNRMGASYHKLNLPAFLAGHDYRKDGGVLHLDFGEGVIAARIRTFRESFGSRLLLCDYRLMERDPLSVLSAIEQFLGLSPHFDQNNFKNVRINAGDQRNIKLVNKLMHQKWFADLVTRLFPKKLIVAVRYRLQSTSSRRSPLEISADDRLLAERRFAADTAYVENLFSEAKIVTGDGLSFGEPKFHATPV